MARRTPLLLLLLAVGAVCVILWQGGLADVFLEPASDDGGSYLEDDDLASINAEAKPEAGPALATTGRARSAGDAADRARLAAAGGEGPGGPRGSDASVSFKGTVLDKDGRPAAGVKIVMQGSAGVETLTTGADGRFEHTARPGRYAMMLDGGEQGGLILRSWMLDGAATDDLEFALKEPAAVQVKVIRGKQGVPEVAVLIVSRDVGELSQQVATTGGDGIALFEGLLPGRYEVTAEVPDGPKVAHTMYAAPAKTNPVNVNVPDGVVFKGTVRAGKDGPGVAGATITLTTQPTNRSHGLYETIFETQSDGTFEVTVPQGRVRDFSVEAEGHARWPSPRQRGAAFKSLRGLTRKKPVKRDVTLLSGAVLTGTVTAEDLLSKKKTLLPGIALRFVMRRGPVIEVTTKADGSFMAANMVPGRYDLQVETPGWFPMTGQPLRVGIPGGATPKATTFDVTLLGARRLHGVVLDAASQGVGGARVWIVGGGRVMRSARNAGRALEVFTNKDGSWLISDIPPDKNVVVRASMGTLEVDPVSASWNKPPPLPLRMQLKGTGDIRGQVNDLDTRTPIAGARVRILPDPYDGRTGRTVYTNGKGEFKVEAMLPGAWKFTPYKRGFLTATAESANVVRGAEVEVGLQLDPGIVFAGVVVDEAGRPLRNVRVSVRGTPEGKDKPISRGASVNAQGRFSVMGFAPGSYRVTAYRRGYRAAAVTNRRRSDRRLRLALRKR